MNQILKTLIITNLLFSSLSIVPLWDFQKSTIDLLSIRDPYDYDITDAVIHDSMRFQLNKKIQKMNGQVEIKNTLIINYNDNINDEVPFQEIESAYTDKYGRYFICPKGRHHVYYFYPKGNIRKKELKHDDFVDEGDWELKCYYQYDQKNLKKLFIFYLNKEEYVYTINDISSDIIQRVGDIKYKILSYQWTDKKKKMVCIPCMQ